VQLQAGPVQDHGVRHARRARRSTDVLAVEDHHLAKALRFIRDHARKPLAVDEVALATTLSRRALERRFRKKSAVQFCMKSAARAPTR